MDPSNFWARLRKFEISPNHILAVGFGILGSAYALVFFIDILSVFGLRGLPGGIVPFFWDSLFVERGIIELTQWTLISGLILCSYKLYRVFSKSHETSNKKFWFLVTITACLMLIEDALNPRHFLFRDILDLHWRRINIAETVYFGSLASIPGYAYLRYGDKVREHRKTILFLVLGGFFYGLAVLISGPGHSFGVSSLGDAGLELTASIGGDELRAAYELSEERIIEVQGKDTDDLAFRFTDHLIEESLELIGATFLLASAVSYLELLKKKELK